MACIDVTHNCLQEAPMLYCGEEIGTGVDPKVSLPVQEILQLHSRPRWKMVHNCCVLPVLELYDGCWSPPLKGLRVMVLKMALLFVQVDIAVDPLDGTTLVSQVVLGTLLLQGAISCLSAHLSSTPSLIIVAVSGSGLQRQLLLWIAIFRCFAAHSYIE